MGKYMLMVIDPWITRPEIPRWTEHPSRPEVTAGSARLRRAKTALLRCAFRLPGEKKKPRGG